MKCARDCNPAQGPSSRSTTLCSPSVHVHKQVCTGSVLIATGFTPPPPQSMSVLKAAVSPGPCKLVHHCTATVSRLRCICSKHGTTAAGPPTSLSRDAKPEPLPACCCARGCSPGICSRRWSFATADASSPPNHQPILLHHNPMGHCVKLCSSMGQCQVTPLPSLGDYSMWTMLC